MLVEVVIVTVVVATIMVSLYVAFNRVYDAYDLKEKYTNIDALYAINTVENQLIDEMKFSEVLPTTTSWKLIECSVFGNESSTPYNYCDSVFTRYKINKLYLLKKENLISGMDNNINQTFKDYANYLNNAVTFNDDSKYIFLVETYEFSTDNDGDGIKENTDILNKYAYLEVK